MKHLALILLLSACISFADKPKAEKNQPLILKHADRMINHGSGDNMWSHLVGNVEFQHGDVNLTSHEADYYRSKQEIRFSKEVCLTVPDKRMTCDKMNYKKSDQKVIARGNLTIVDTREHMTLTGDWGEYFRDKEIAKIYGKPVLTAIDTTAGDTFKITSDSMIYEDENKKTTARGHVVVTSNDFKSTGGLGTYYEDKNRAYLTDEPVFFDSTTHMEGELIELFLNDKELEKIYICNNAQGSYYEKDSVSDTIRISELKGDTIRILLKEDVIRNILVDHNAKSYYYYPDEKDKADEAWGRFIRMVMDRDGVKEAVVNGNAESIYYNREDTKVTGYNNASGDTIHVIFDANQVSSVSVFGGAQGSYFILE